MRTIEDTYIDMIAAKTLGILNDPETLAALNIDAGEDFSINEEGVWGNGVDIKEFEDTQLTIRTEKTMNFMGSRGTPKF
jgi:hypothetical protein